MPDRTMKDLKQLYESGVNIMRLLRVTEGTEFNDIDAILAAYDLQSGSYVQSLTDPVAASFNLTYTGAVATILDRYSPTSVMEAGTGEATTLVNVVLQMKHQPRHVLGFDISWSRLAVGREFSREKGAQPQLFIGDLNAIPIEDNAVDVVFTSHSIEPNRGREASILKELFRVTKDYLVLLEPSNELGSELTRQHIEQHK
jgi:ubiquinone/menaquinone biosynthesis C-methylase UbiE